MPSDKERLYIALYARGGASEMPGGEDRYHWGFLVGPKTETNQSRGKRYHAKNQITPAGMQWVYEEISCTLEATNMLLVRVLIGKVEQRDRLESLMGSVPVVQGNAAWNCVSWVKEALRKLQADGRAIGTSQLDWKVVRDAAINYVERKKEQHRFDGNGNFNLKKAATFDLLAGVEVVH